jgi:methyl-accepting chemotaxis protein
MPGGGQECTSQGATATHQWRVGDQMIDVVRERRLAKFIASFAVVIAIMAVVGVFAFLDTASQLDAENHWIVAQNLTLLIAVTILGVGTVAVLLVRPTVKQIEELATEAEAIEAGELDSGISPRADDELGSLYRSVNSMRETIKERIEEAEAQKRRAEEAREESETQRERAEAAQAESEELATRLEERTMQFADTMDRTASGDLTARLRVDGEDPESLKRVATSFNEAMDELQTIVGDVGGFTDQVVTAGEASTDNIDDAVDRAQETSAAMDETAQDARQQSDDLAVAAKELESMSATIEEVAASTDQLASNSERAADVTEEGRENAQTAVDELHKIESRSESAAETMNELEAEMDEIEQIVTTIREIAEQTNMLALNASIEAARAGSQTGSDVADGFDVVANEVKALAEETQESAGEVETMITELRALTEASAEDMRTIQQDVKSGVDIVEDVGNGLADIETQVTEVDQGVQQITTAMDQQAKSLTDVTATVDELTEFSDDTAQRTQELADAADEQTTTLVAASDNTHTLLARAEQLQSSLEQFRYEDQTLDGEAEVASNA